MGESRSEKKDEGRIVNPKHDDHERSCGSIETTQIALLDVKGNEIFSCSEEGCGE